MISIGIDYGTSNSEVAFFDGQKHQFIKLDPSEYTANKTQMKKEREQISLLKLLM